MKNSSFNEGNKESAFTHVGEKDEALAPEKEASSHLILVDSFGHLPCCTHKQVVYNYLPDDYSIHRMKSFGGQEPCNLRKKKLCHTSKHVCFRDFDGAFKSP